MWIVAIARMGYNVHPIKGAIPLVVVKKSQTQFCAFIFLGCTMRCSSRSCVHSSGHSFSSDMQTLPLF